MDRPRAQSGGPATASQPADQPKPAPALPDPQNFPEVVALLGERREAILQAHLVNNVHLVRFEPGRLEINPDQHAPRNLSNRLGTLLSEWTGKRWVVAISGEPGEPTLASQAAHDEVRERAEVVAHPLVQAVLSAFPGATIDAVRDLATTIEPPADGDEPA
jgi:DNA polymerase-3 subunit gamma/tau